MIASTAGTPLCRNSKTKVEYSLRKTEQILDKPIIEFYNSDDVSLILLELRQTQARSISLYLQV